jgi:uncharacterized protein YfaS (alpha-2-macroglobulin family)
VLVEAPRPSGFEVVAADDRRFTLGGDRAELREDREALVAFHHERPGAAVLDDFILLAETAGDLVVPPARAELMYRPETAGHSGTFRLRVLER